MRNVRPIIDQDVVPSGIPLSIELPTRKMTMEWVYISDSTSDKFTTWLIDVHNLSKYNLKSSVHQPHISTEILTTKILD